MSAACEVCEHPLSEHVLLGTGCINVDPVTRDVCTCDGMPPQVGAP